MATPSASLFASKNAYTKSKYELQFSGKAHMDSCPRLRPSNSFKSLQIKSCSLNPTLNNSMQSSNDNLVQGMKIIFVSADIALWSKTGDLGNLLDGLPLAMAVLFRFLCLSVYKLKTKNMNLFILQKA
jgi:hypothetical protein